MNVGELSSAIGVSKRCYINVGLGCGCGCFLTGGDDGVGDVTESHHHVLNIHVRAVIDVIVRCLLPLLGVIGFQLRRLLQDESIEHNILNHK